jgi:hypothetical protein
VASGGGQAALRVFLRAPSLTSEPCRMGQSSQMSRMAMMTMAMIPRGTITWPSSSAASLRRCPLLSVG